jgi:hypothetical protein
MSSGSRVFLGAARGSRVFLGAARSSTVFVVNPCPGIVSAFGARDGEQHKGDASKKTETKMVGARGVHLSLSFPTISK